MTSSTPVAEVTARELAAEVDLHRLVDPVVAPAFRAGLARGLELRVDADGAVAVRPALPPELGTVLEAVVAWLDDDLRRAPDLLPVTFDPPRCEAVVAGTRTAAGIDAHDADTWSRGAALGLTIRSLCFRENAPPLPAVHVVRDADCDPGRDLGRLRLGTLRADAALRVAAGDVVVSVGTGGAVETCIALERGDGATHRVVLGPAVTAEIDGRAFDLAAAMPTDEPRASVAWTRVIVPRTDATATWHVLLTGALYVGANIAAGVGVSRLQWFSADDTDGAATADGTFRLTEHRTGAPDTSDVATNSTQLVQQVIARVDAWTDATRTLWLTVVAGGRDSSGVALELAELRHALDAAGLGRGADVSIATFDLQVDPNGHGLPLQVHQLEIRRDDRHVVLHLAGLRRAQAQAFGSSLLAELQGRLAAASAVASGDGAHGDATHLAAAADHVRDLLDDLRHDLVELAHGDTVDHAVLSPVRWELERLERRLGEARHHERFGFLPRLGVATAIAFAVGGLVDATIDAVDTVSDGTTWPHGVPWVAGIDLAVLAVAAGFAAWRAYRRWP